MNDYAGIAGSLDVQKIPISWDSSIFEDSTADHLSVSLYGYREVEVCQSFIFSLVS